MTAARNDIIKSGLIAGAIGGEAMILLVLVNTILLKSFVTDQNMKMSGMESLWGVAYPLIIILVFEGGGIFSSWLCRVHIRNDRDALIAGTITGITMGIILEIMWLANILSLASRSVVFGAGIPGGTGSSLVVIFLLMVLVGMGSILSAFGSYTYFSYIFRSEGTGTLTG